jgi:hypothetical protein
VLISPIKTDRLAIIAEKHATTPVRKVTPWKHFCKENKMPVFRITLGTSDTNIGKASSLTSTDAFPRCLKSFQDLKK